jgi:hypothetical protein
MMTDCSRQGEGAAFLVRIIRQTVCRFDSRSLRSFNHIANERVKWFQSMCYLCSSAVWTSMKKRSIGTGFHCRRCQNINWDAPPIGDFWQFRLKRNWYFLKTITHTAQLNLFIKHQAKMAQKLGVSIHRGGKETKRPLPNSTTRIIINKTLL